MSDVQHSERGFTLIELMITIVIVAILTAIALPSYREYVDRGRRAEAKAALLVNAQWMERFRGDSNTYVLTAGASLPVLQTPQDGTAATYTMTAATSAITFTLTATRTGVMAADNCGDFSVTNTGLRGLTNNNSAAGFNLERCWGR